MSDILNLTSICRCCHKDGQFKSLHSPYLCDGCVDVYANVMSETFGIALKYPPCEASFSICDECISQLKQAYHFKKQVLSCELKFAEYCKNELAGVVKVETDDEDEVPDDTAEVVENNQNSTDVECKKNEDFDNIEAHELLKVEVEKDEQVEITLEPITEEKTKKEKCKNTVKSVVKRKRPIRVRQKSQKDVVGVKVGASESKSSENSLLGKKSNIKFDNSDVFQIYKRKKHKSKRVDAKKHKCEICKEKLTSDRQFVKHMKETHNMEKPFKCTFCEKSFTNLPSLKCHTNSHEDRDFYQCDFCGKKFYKKVYIVTHLKLHYETTKKYICDLCGWTFNDTTNLGKHIAGVHENLRPFSCTFCDKTFKYKKHCTEHLRTHTGELFNCELCGWGFISKYYLGRHMQEKHSNATKNTLKCVICQKQLSDKSCYRRHMRLHKGDRPHKCTLCPREFTCKFMLRRHIDSHKGIKKFECDVCKKRFFYKTSVLKHKQNVHGAVKKMFSRNGIKKFECEICKRRFTLKSSVQKHKANIHVAKKKFYCAKCDSYVCSLESHKCIKCHLCEMCFLSDVALKRHVRVTHKKLHACNLCPKKYLSQNRLLKHMNIEHNVECNVKNIENEVVAYSISKSQ